MGDDVTDQETAIELARAYTESECVGQFGAVTDVEERDAEWRIEFETHTFSETHAHRVRITKAVGNVISHDRVNRFE